MELQPLTGSQDGDRYYSREGKGILSRMPRVLSDDTSQEDEQSPPPSDTKLGAGLPLLNRLKLLKDKQDKEAPESTKEVVVTPTTKEEPEVIGAGLPLMQRLLLLKQKEDAERDITKLQTTANQTAQVLSSTVRTQMRSPSITLRSDRSRDKSREEDLPLKPIISKKTKDSVSPGKYGGVSWKDNSKDQDKSTQICLNATGEKTDVVIESRPKPKPQMKLQSLLKQAGLGMKSGVVPKPSTSSEKSLIASTVDSGKDNLKQDSTGEPQSVLKPSIESKDMDSTSKISLEMVQSGESTDKDSYSSVRSISSDSETTTNLPKESAQFAQEIKSAQSCSISQDNNTNLESQSSSSKDSALIDIEARSKAQLEDDSGKAKTHITKPSSLKLDKDNKIYRSIDDLSPEYFGLPFVKQLRILNERQKYTELEDKGFLRSSSLDSAHGSEAKDQSSNLTRSHSEAMAIEVVLRNQQLRSQEVAAQKLGLPLTTESSPMSPEAHLTSPESNETLERRQLKSILKKLSSTNLASSSSNVSESEDQPSKPSSSAEFKKLMRAQTVEGYAARHSKLTKSVTFNRDTLQSPPSGLCTPSTLQSKPVFQFPKTSSSLDDSSSERTVPRLSSSLDTQLKTRDLTLTSINSGSLSPVVNDEEVSSSGDSDSSQESKPSVVVTTQSTVSQTETLTTLYPPTSEMKTTNSFKTSHSETRETKTPEPRRPPGSWMERPQAKQKNFYRPGSILLPTHASQEEEFFGGILSGIKTIIRNHLVSISF